MARRAGGPMLVDELTQLQRQLSRSLDSALSPLDLTVDQWRALRALAAGPGLTMGELTDRLLTPPPTTTRLVDGLVDRALVYRRASATDRRRVEAALTDAGHTLLGRAESVARRHETHARAELDVTALARLLTDDAPPAVV